MTTLVPFYAFLLLFYELLEPNWSKRPLSRLRKLPQSQSESLSSADVPSRRWRNIDAIQCNISTSFVSLGSGVERGGLRTSSLSFSMSTQPMCDSIPLPAVSTELLCFSSFSLSGSKTGMEWGRQRISSLSFRGRSFLILGRTTRRFHDSDSTEYIKGRKETKTRSLQLEPNPFDVQV